MPIDAARRSDTVAQALLCLAREVWLLRDRQIVSEAILAERGLDLRAAIDHYQPSAEVAERLARERHRFTAEIVAALAPPKGPAA
jgi:hypothetical protein